MHAFVVCIKWLWGYIRQVSSALYCISALTLSQYRPVNFPYIGIRVPGDLFCVQSKTRG